MSTTLSVRAMWKTLTQRNALLTCQRFAIQHQPRQIKHQQRYFTTSSTQSTNQSTPASTSSTSADSSHPAVAAHAAASSINQTIQSTINQTTQTPVNLNLPPTQAPKPGFLISDATVFLSDGTQETINDLLKSKRCLLLGFVGAFTRLDQQSFVAYAHKAAELKKKYGIDHVYALSVNDHSVLSAFKDSLSLQSYTGVTLIADFDARMTRWLGMEIDLSSVGFGVRSKRFAMLVDKQQVKVVRVESNVGLLDVTSLESMTQVLKEMKKEEVERAKVEKDAASQAAAAAGVAAAAEVATQPIDHVEMPSIEDVDAHPTESSTPATESQQTASAIAHEAASTTEQTTQPTAAASHTETATSESKPTDTPPQ